MKYEPKAPQIAASRTLEKTFDVSRPFMAIVPHEGDYFDPTHIVYLVNPTHGALSNIYEATSGSFSDDHTTYETIPKPPRGPYTLLSRSALQLESSSQDELDELLCGWEITYELDGAQNHVAFSAGKGLGTTKQLDVCPILNCSALLLMREWSA